jgi:hypothetical protein
LGGSTDWVSGVSQADTLSELGFAKNHQTKLNWETWGVKNKSVNSIAWHDLAGIVDKTVSTGT